MNLVIFRELKRILKSKDITVTVDKNIYDMRVLGEQLVHWENPAKSTLEMRMLMEIVDLIRQRDQEQTTLLCMTEREKVLLKKLQDINARTK